MLRYSELTTPQKKLIDEMRKGHELTYFKGKCQYILFDGVFTSHIRFDTASSLRSRHFITPCFDDFDKQVFCVNIEIEGFGTKF